MSANAIKSNNNLIHYLHNIMEKFLQINNRNSQNRLNFKFTYQKSSLDKEL